MFILATHKPARDGCEHSHMPQPQQNKRGGHYVFCEKTRFSYVAMVFCRFLAHPTHTTTPNTHTSLERDCSALFESTICTLNRGFGNYKTKRLDDSLFFTSLAKSWLRKLNVHSCPAAEGIVKTRLSCALKRARVVERMDIVVM